MCRHHNHAVVVEGPAGHKLPTTIVPKHLDIKITPDFTTFDFVTDERIELDVTEPVTEIVAHGRDLIVSEAYVVDANGTRLDAIMTTTKVTRVDPTTFEEKVIEVQSACSLDEETQRATFKFAGTLGKGHWTLHAKMTGSMVQPSLEGFYRSKWTDEAGKDHWIGTTQFEATHARRAFICWDEPAVKLTTDVTLVVDEHLTALSNGRIKSSTVEGGKKTVVFHTTPKMSTYLIAFCIGEFESSEPVFANGKEIRIWAVPGKNHMKEYALQVAAFGVKWYERFTAKPYFGGDKIDMIAIPDFRSGAMENTGLITYRATALLVDLRHATEGEKKRVAEVVLHELAHQWFGNLVTMAWWDGLPLNESNATIFAYLSMDDFCPEWEIFNDFGIDRAGAFALDSLKSTHPCWAPVGHPDEVEQRFDQITYEKGGSLELQLARFIGLEHFRTGMRIYMERFQYGNTEVTDLWDALEEGARADGLDVPVRHIMDQWFLNDGHPVVTVTESDKPGFIKLHQERFQFLADGKNDQLWPIPLHIRYETEAGEVREERFLFSTREQEVYIDKGFKWVVANAGGPGFYRVRYSDSLLSRLTDKPFDTLKVIERFNLVNDSWALVRAQKLASTTYLGLVKKLAAEKDPNVWAIVSGSLNTLHGLTDGDHRAAFKALIRELVKPVFDELGWTPKEGESSATLELRGSLAGLLGTIGEDAAVQAKARELFDAWKSDRSKVNPNVVPALVATMAYTGDKARFDEFVALSKAAPTDQEKLRFLNALGKFRTPELYNQAIAMMLAEVKTDDAPFILGAYLGTEHAGESTWDFIRANWKQMQDKFPASGIVRMIGGCSALDTEELQSEVETFFAANKVKQGDMAVAQMLERLSVNVRLRQAETASLKSFLVPAGKGEAKETAAAAKK